MKSKPKLLMLMFFLHVYKLKTSPAAPSIDESKVKSFVLERKAGLGYDFFTVNMKSSHTCTDGTVSGWCKSLEALQDQTKGNHSSCSCHCWYPYYSFIPPMRTCIKVAAAQIFLGCENYFNTHTLLMQTPVDLTRKSSNKWFLKVNPAHNCTLVGNNTYFSYSGFQSKWETIDDGFFSLDQQGYISWQMDAMLSPKLSGRIIRLVVKCSETQPTTSCFLFKSLGKVTYNGPVHVSSSTSSSHPTVSSTHRGSHVSLLPTTSSSVTISSSSLSLPSSPSPSPLSLTSSSSESSPPSTLLSSTSSSAPHPPPTGTPYHSTNTVIYPIEPSKTTTVASASSAAGVVPGDSGKRTGGNDKLNGVIIGAPVGGAVVLGIFFITIIVFWKRRKACESSEKQTKPVKNPVYGSSENAIQLEAPKESKAMPSTAQGAQPTYQSLINDNGKSNQAAIYSSADDEYDNCTMYQSLDKQIPGTPVYGRLNKGLPEPAHTTGLPKPKPKAKTSAAGIPTSEANDVTGLPKPKPATTGQGTTPEPLYNVLKVTDNPAYEPTLAFDAPYAALIHRPGMQRESVYEPGGKTCKNPLYESISQSDNQHSAC